MQWCEAVQGCVLKVTTFLRANCDIQCRADPASPQGSGTEGAGQPLTKSPCGRTQRVPSSGLVGVGVRGLWVSRQDERLRSSSAMVLYHLRWSGWCGAAWLWYLRCAGQTAVFPCCSISECWRRVVPADSLRRPECPCLPLRSARPGRPCLQSCLSPRVPGAGSRRCLQSLIQFLSHATSVCYRDAGVVRQQGHLLLPHC